MTYNIKSLSQLAALIAFTLLFLIGGVTYMLCKTRAEIRKKRTKF